jgi:hypothetical protein
LVPHLVAAGEPLQPVTEPRRWVDLQPIDDWIEIPPRLRLLIAAGRDEGFILHATDWTEAQEPASLPIIVR